MMAGGLSDGWGELRTGLRELSGLSRLLRGPPLAVSSGGSAAGTILQGLLVQAGERRNAENLSESVGISARAMQRFLTEARWSDDAVIGRLQEYLAPRLGHSEAVWVLDGSDFPKQGRKSVGVARQYCGRLGKVANCQAGMFLAYVSPLGRALVDKGLYLPESWASDPGRCAAAGVPEGAAELPVEDGVGLGTGGASLGVGPPQRPVGCRGRRLRDVAVLPGVPGGLGDALRAGCSGQHSGLALAAFVGAFVDQSGLSGVRAPPANPGWWTGSAVPWSSAVKSCRMRLGGR